MSRLRFESESVLIYSARFTLRKDLWQDPPFNEILAGFLARFFSSLEIFAGYFLEISSESLRNFCRILVGFLAHFMGFSFKFLSKSLQDSWRILGGFLEDSWLISYHGILFQTSFKILAGFLRGLEDSCRIPGSFSFLGILWKIPGDSLQLPSKSLQDSCRIV